MLYWSRRLFALCTNWFIRLMKYLEFQIPGRTVAFYPTCLRCHVSFMFAPYHCIWVYDEKTGCFPYGGVLCKHCHYDVSKKEREWYWSKAHESSWGWDQIQAAIRKGW